MMRVVLSLGRLHPLKGLDLLVSAWAEVVKSSLVHYCDSAVVGATEGRDKITNVLPRWQLVIAGPDEQGTKEKLKGISEKLNLKWCESEEIGVEGDTDIIFMEPVHGEKKWALMQRADIFVLPSRSENFGMVVGEALSCGVPVVTTAVGPWGEGRGERSLARADKSKGLFVVETSVEGIAEGLRHMMMLSDAERKEMGLKGYEWVKHEFNWGAVAKKMVAAYEAAMR